MKKFLYTAVVIWSAVFICGCGHTPVRKNLPVAVPPHTADAQTVAARSNGLKNILAPLKVRGVGIFPAAFFGRFTNEQVLDAIEATGFNRIYCQLTSEQELNDDLAAFLAAAAGRDIPVELVFSQQDFYRRYRGNRLIRNLFIQYPDLTEAVSEAVKYNLELPENIRIAGITVIFTPHLFNGDNTQRIRGHLYRWADNRYGIGQDNDMLMKEAMEYLQQISAIEALPPLTVAVSDFYHEKAVAGELSCGKISDFARYADKVIVISSANLPSKVHESVRQELSESSGDIQLIVAVPLATHTSFDSGRLRRRNWQDFQRTIDYLVRQSAANPAFQGIIISPFAVVEYLRQEK